MVGVVFVSSCDGDYQMLACKAQLAKDTVLRELRIEVRKLKMKVKSQRAVQFEEPGEGAKLDGDYKMEVEDGKES